MKILAHKTKGNNFFFVEKNANSFIRILINSLFLIAISFGFMENESCRILIQRDIGASNNY